MAPTRLGLIGDNIIRSQSPRLHVEAGRLCGLDVTYERLIPRDLGIAFGAVFDRCAEQGFRGINVTYPYKEDVVARLVVPDAATAKIRACNTVLYETSQPEGFNTDYTGFVSAFRSTFGGAEPGIVAMVGAGGVGKAISFALGELGARELRIVDADHAKAERLAASLSASAPTTRAIAVAAITDAVDHADGLINCTPLGMTGHSGTAMERHHMTGASWAFDAVYTPINTEFLRIAEDAGIAIMSGYELFFHQGIDAFRHFTGMDVDPAALRHALAETQLEKLAT